MQYFDASKQIEKWDLFELCLAGPEEGNPFIDICLSAQPCQNHFLEKHP